MKSFIVTGASASGKTTLINEAMKNGYTHLPTHTTRTPREGEIEGIHNVYMDLSTFKLNFERGIYFEHSMAYAEKNGVYYGTPYNWIRYLKKDNYCATPVTPLIANIIYRYTEVIWISLVCDEEIRKRRLISRGISKEEIEARLNTIKEQRNLPAEVMIFDTTHLSVSEIFEKIKEKNDG